MYVAYYCVCYTKSVNIRFQAGNKHISPNNWGKYTMRGGVGGQFHF